MRAVFCTFDGPQSVSGVNTWMVRFRPRMAAVGAKVRVFVSVWGREGILKADWQQCPYVHFVEVDFIPGVFHSHAFDTAEPRSMYGGLAVALMLPEKRNPPLVIHQSQRGLYDTVFQHSCHVQQAVRPLTSIGDKFRSIGRRLIGR